MHSLPFSVLCGIGILPPSNPDASDHKFAPFKASASCHHAIPMLPTLNLEGRNARFRFTGNLYSHFFVKYYRNRLKPSKSVIFKPDSMRKYYRNSIKPSRSVILKPDSLGKYYKNSSKPSKSVILSPDPKREDYINNSANSSLFNSEVE